MGQKRHDARRPGAKGGSGDTPSSTRESSRDGGGTSPPPSSPRPLTPYQARFDVEMDDTAVSKVRDPSVSFRVSGRPGSRTGIRRPGPAASLALGIAGGIAIVMLLALVVRGCGG